MGYYDDYGTQIMNSLKASYKNAENKLKGQTAGAKRQANANLNVSNERMGISNSPVGSGLKAETISNIDTKARDALLGLEENKTKAIANATQDIEARKAQEKLQRDISNQQMWGNILGGAGSLLGTIYKLKGLGGISTYAPPELNIPAPPA